MRSGDGRLIVVTGAMAAGKFTVAQLLAERFTRSIHVRGDVFRRFVVNGAAEPEPPLTPEMLAQLRLRYRAGVAAAQTYAAAGFTAVVQDVMIGPVLADVVDMITFEHAFLVVLDPDADAVREREQVRSKTGYSNGFDPTRFVADLRAGTPRLGLWLDTTRLTPDETVAVILDRLPEARIGRAPDP